MKRITLLTIVFLVGACLSGFCSNVFAFGTGKFEKEVKKEEAAVKLFLAERIFCFSRISFPS